MSDTVRTVQIDNLAESVTPEWPQVWIGVPTCQEEAGPPWGSRNSANYRRDPGLYTRWSEDGEIWYTDPNFEQAFEVLQVPAEAIQVAGVRL